MAGRPTKYKKEYNEQAYGLCLLGYTDKELANHFGVDESTINNWKVKYLEFFESVNRGKEIADVEVAKAFYKKAKGFRYQEVTEEGTNGQMTVTKVVTKEQAPDAGAALNWLKNRQPNKWRDKKDVELSGEVRKTLDLSKLSESDLDEYERIITKLENDKGIQGEI